MRRAHRKTGVKDDVLHSTQHVQKNILYVALRIRPLKDKNNAPVVMEILLNHVHKTQWALPRIERNEQETFVEAIQQDCIKNLGVQASYVGMLPILEHKETMVCIVFIKEANTPHFPMKWFSLFRNETSMLLSHQSDVLQYKKTGQVWSAKSIQQLQDTNIALLCEALSLLRNRCLTSTIFFHLLEEPFTITRAIKVHDLLSGMPITREMYTFRYMQYTQLLYQEKGGRRTKYFRYANVG